MPIPVNIHPNAAKRTFRYQGHFEAVIEMLKAQIPEAKKIRVHADWPRLGRFKESIEIVVDVTYSTMEERHERAIAVNEQLSLMEHDLPHHMRGRIMIAVE